MNPIVNLNVAIENELKLERQGVRRTRRWIGDVEVADARWYKRELSQVSDTKQYPVVVKRVVENKTHRGNRGNILTRLFHLPRTRPQPTSNEV